MRKILLIVSLLTLTGCFTSFVNWVKVSPPAEFDSARMMALADEVARKNGLTFDVRYSSPTVYQAYFGKPYHHYVFEIRYVDGRPVAAFVHNANMSSPKQREDAPEKEFLERATAEFGAESVVSFFEEPNGERKPPPFPQ